MTEAEELLGMGKRLIHSVMAQTIAGAIAMVHLTITSEREKDVLLHGLMGMVPEEMVPAVPEMVKEYAKTVKEGMIAGRQVPS